MFYWVIHQVSIKLKCFLALCYNISIQQINIHLQINQAIQMFKCIFMKALGKIITTQMTINNKEDYIVLFFTTLFYFNILSNMYLQKGDFFFDVVRKLIKTVTGTIYMDILALAARCYIRTHEIWNPLSWWIQYIYS